MRSAVLMRQILIGGHTWQSAKITPAVNAALYSSKVLKRKDTRSQSLDIYKRQSLCIPNCNSGLSVDIQRTKGHSHWQNIRHAKGERDALLMKKVTNYINLMKGAINENGPDPNKNAQLSKIMQEMKDDNIPKANIQRYLENATKRLDSETRYFEVRGPSGSLFVLEVETMNLKKSTDLLHSLVRKTTGRLPQGSSMNHVFDKKGVITVPVTDSMQVANMDEYLEVAIETGAEDVILTTGDITEDGESTQVLKFHCDPKLCSKVAQDIEENFDLEVFSYIVELFPYHWVSIESEKEIAECKKIAEMLQKHEDFVALYDNISLPQE